MLGRSDQPVATASAATYAAGMSEQTPASGPVTDGPADPEHDATAAYGLDRAYVASLTRRLVSTTGETVAVASPIGGTPLAHVPQSSPADVAEAFARARRAQASWAATSVDDRAAALLRLHDLLLDRQEELIDLVVLGVGQGPQGRLPRGRPPRAHRALLRPHRPRAPRHPARRRHVPGAHPGRGQPRAEGCRRHHLAVELPAHDGALRRHPGAAGRQRGRVQARRADRCSPRCSPPSCSRRRASRPRPVAGRRRPRSRGRAARSSANADYVCFTGSTATGRHHRQAVRRAADRLLARARWQEPDARAPRRRRAPGRRGRRPARSSPTPASCASRWSASSSPTRSTTASSTPSSPARRR